MSNTFIEEVLDNFDFHKVHKVMEYFNWGWGEDGTVPDVPALKRTARWLLEDAYTTALADCGDARLSYGGFSVTVDTCVGEDQDPDVQLLFVLEEVDNYFQ